MRHVLTTASVLGIAAVGLLTGCPDRTISEVTPQQGRVEYKDIPIHPNRNIDILFVIDDSPSMADKQANLANNFPNFINVLNTIEGGLPDVHIGVVTSDVGTKTTQDPSPAPAISGCTGDGKKGNLSIGLATAADLTGSFISDIKLNDGTRQKNYTGDLGILFGKMAKVGAAGCGFEQHLEAMKRALSPTTTANAGFLRPDAYLAVIFIADEDDCSMSHNAVLGPESAALGPLQSFRCTRFGVTCDQGGTTTDAMNQIGSKGACHPNEGSAYLEKVATYVDFLKGLKADSSKVIVAGIMGTPEPFGVELRAPQGTSTPIPQLAHSCMYQGAMGLEVADPPTRIKFLLDQFPSRSTFTSICQTNLTDGLVLIAQLLKTIIGDPCINGKLADVDPDPNVKKFDCSVSDITNFGKPNQVETVLPECTTTLSNKPCWHIVADPVKCPTQADGSNPDNYILKFERLTEAPEGSHSVSYCVTEAT